MAAEISFAGEERIGGFRYVRTIHPGATTAVLEVVQESGREAAVRLEADARESTHASAT